MNIKLHRNATTTPRIRAELQASKEPDRVLAERYNIRIETVQKWRRRDSVHDRSHRPKSLNTTLSRGQEIIVCELRKTLLLSLDDLLVVTREFINPKASRSALDRLLRREGISNLRDLVPEAEGEKRPKKTFKDYDPGYVHIDVKYLPQMPDQTSRSYLFVAIDRATRWVYLEVKSDKSARSARSFLNAVIKAAPFKIKKVLTDNGKEFTDRFTSQGERNPTGRHDFDKVCADNKIEHRLTRPFSPQTNGMVERFNARVGGVIEQTKFASIMELTRALKRYEKIYNGHIPQRALGHLTPIEKLKEWQKNRPELFNKRVYNLTGLDT